MYLTCDYREMTHKEANLFAFQDNCPYVFNTFQPDADNDGVGDACDNCPSNANADQANVDGDSMGDVCDTDMDGDLVLNLTPDNCPYVSNAGKNTLSLRIYI